MKKKYIITDPCYILPENVWSECFDKAYLEPDFDNDKFIKALKKALEDFSGSKAFVNKTGFGDWKNHLWFQGAVIGEFIADSGMVCVCEFTEPVKETMKNILSCGAIFEAEDDISVDFDTNLPDWTIIKITDSNNNQWSTDLDYSDDIDE